MRSSTRRRPMGRDRVARSVARTNARRPRIIVTDVDEDSDLEAPSRQRARSDSHPATEDDGVYASNYYITPVEVITFLESHPEIYERIDDTPYLNLLSFRELIENLLTADPSLYVPFWRGARDGQDFLVNEIKKLTMVSREDAKRRTWMFPHLIGLSGSTLSIPSNDVYDLPIYVMLYILLRLSQIAEKSPSFTVNYLLGVDDDVTTYPMYDDDNSPITVIDGRITDNDIFKIYMEIMKRFVSFYPEGESTWNGSEGSGTRIMLLNNGGKVRMRLKIDPIETASVSRAHGWTQEVEDLLTNSVGTAVMSVRNKTDNKCLLYCIIMGLITKIKDDGYARVFGLNKVMVDSNEVYCKGMFMFSAGDTGDKVAETIRKLSILLMPPDYSSGPVTPLAAMVEDIDRKAGTMISTAEFRKEFEDIENKLIPEDVCGVDVYGIDFNVNPHIYPLYVSKRREKVIELLCVTPLDTRCSHYALIVNMERLLKNSGGKQFFTCSRCGACFYHRRLLNEHQCPVALQSGSYPLGQLHLEGGYHFSDKYAREGIDRIVYTCSKCRLAFTDDFSAEYHKQHCFMEGKTGFRHIQLVSYKDEEHPMLRGEEVDEEDEAKFMSKTRILYADFESSITPETGEHVFMSFGIYNWSIDEYKCGYTMKDFFDYILKTAFEGEEENIYIYFHNAMGYDANFILRHVMKTPEFSLWGIRVIMKSSNRLQKLVFHAKLGDKVRNIHIGDSFHFLSLSLERLVESIRKDDIDMNIENFERFFVIFRRKYPWVKDEDINHILRKNIFPYKFFTDSSKLDVAIDEFRKIFEPKEENLQFFGERVTVEELEKGFEDTQNVIEIFRCTNARDYHDLYLCCDVMQLADIFNRSMEILWESHKIHLPRYIGMPSATWAAFLRYNSSMEIPLYENTFFAEFFKGMLRGGLTSAVVRRTKRDENHSIIYLDVNGLYPYVMQKYKYPCANLQFVPLGWEGKELCSVRLKEQFEMFERNSMGMCYCVDLDIPDYLKEITDMYPFAPEHRRIFKEYFSDFERKEMTPFLKRWSAANNGAKMQEFTGLVCTLYPKEKYNVHWQLLRFYIDHGANVTKVHFGVSFDEGYYLDGYIRMNIEIRNTRKDELGKKLYKDCGNCTYGKTLENPMKRNTFEIVRDKVKLQGLIQEGKIAAITPIDDLGWVVRMDGDDIILDKPTYVGACVCEYSKLHMYILLYDKLMKIFPSVPGELERGCQLIYTDTDSFIVKVRHPPDEHITCPEELFAYIKRKDQSLIGGVGGQVKSETGEDDTIDEIVALRSKVYAYKTIKGHIGKRAKGTTHDAQEMQLDWETYVKAVESLTSINTRNVQFLRKTFLINSIDVFRQSLSVNDGKRFICKDGIHTHAFGYPLPLSEIV